MPDIEIIIDFPQISHNGCIRAKNINSLSTANPLV
jgi:hypothetical protein